MSSGPAARRDYSEIIKDLTYDMDKSEKSRIDNGNGIKARCPHVKIKLKNNSNPYETWALIDSGSYATCTSEYLYKKIAKDNVIKELSVNNLVVSVAIRKKR